MPRSFEIAAWASASAVGDLDSEDDEASITGLVLARRPSWGAKKTVSGPIEAAKSSASRPLSSKRSRVAFFHLSSVPSRAQISPPKSSLSSRMSSWRESRALTVIFGWGGPLSSSSPTETATCVPSKNPAAHFFFVSCTSP